MGLHSHLQMSIKCLLPKRLGKFSLYHSSMHNLFHQIFESHLKCAHGHPSFLRIFLPVDKLF
jgi:hypothetical protein